MLMGLLDDGTIRKDKGDKGDFAHSEALRSLAASMLLTQYVAEFVYAEEQP